MKKKDNVVCHTTPWTTKDFIRIGIGVFVLGLVLVLVALTFYRNGAEAQMVNTKWGTEVMGREQPRNPLYLLLVICSGMLSASGLLSLGIGIVRKLSHRANGTPSPQNAKKMLISTRK